MQYKQQPIKIKHLKIFSEISMENMTVETSNTTNQSFYIHTKPLSFHSRHMYLLSFFSEEI